MRSIKEVLESFFKKFPYKEDIEISKLWINWTRVIGGKFGQIAYPLGRRDKILVIGVKDNVSMQEIYFRKIEILKKIEKFLGYQPFEDVVVEFLGSKTPLNKIRLKNRD